MQPAGAQDGVLVTDAATIVDARHSARTTSLRAEQIDRLPKDSDFSAVVGLASAVNREQEKLGGISIDGASAGENRYLVDGADTTDLRTGTQAKTVLPDFLAEVQVTSSGHAAEHRGASGGVVDVVTASGTNRWRGSALVNLETDALQVDSLEGRYSTRALRLGLADSNIAEVVEHEGDGFTRVEPVVSVGGPIVRDRTWVFAGYSPAYAGIGRRATLTADGSAVTTRQRQQRQSLTASSTSTLGGNLRTRVAYNNSWSKVDGLLVASDGTDAPGTDYDAVHRYPNWSLSGQADWVASPNLHLGARAGYALSDHRSVGVPAVSVYRFLTSNIGMPGVPAPLQQATNYQTAPTNLATAFDEQARLAFQAGGTWYGRLAGQHAISGGIQVERIGNAVQAVEQGNVLGLYWGRSYAGTAGAYGYYRVRSNGILPQQGFLTGGDVSTSGYGFFVQDAWTVAARLTLALGLRAENEKVPAYEAGPGIPTYPIEFGFADRLAPRAGFAYDIRGDGRWKAYGSWGKYYDAFKLELPRSSFGGEKWVDYWYTLDTPDWSTLDDSPTCPPACPGTLIAGPVDFRRPAAGPTGVDPALRPMQAQEFSIGMERQLTRSLAVTARYVRKWLVRAVEDTGSLDAMGNETFLIANPGEGRARLAWDDPPANQPRARRDYDGVEVALTKTLADNYSVRASYLWSRLYGNYSGLSQSDENGRTSPNVGRAFDHPLQPFDQGADPVFGRLGTDRTHQLKTSFFYQTGFGMSVGLNGYVATGIPRTREMPVVWGHEYPLQYLGRVSDGRLPFVSQTDLLVQQEFALAGGRRLLVSLNVLNLYNEENVVNYFATEAARGASVALDARQFFLKQTPPIAELKARQDVPTDPRFLMDSRWQAPLAARFGVKFAF
jgi:hypothetical protein